MPGPGPVAPGRRDEAEPGGLAQVLHVPAGDAVPAGQRVGEAQVLEHELDGALAASGGFLTRSVPAPGRAVSRGTGEDPQPAL